VKLANAEADVTREPLEARVSRRIARDEASHAALGFEVLRWLNREVDDLVGIECLTCPETAALRPAPGSSFLHDAAVERLARAMVAAASRELHVR
jgi:hypothetical protein